MCHDTNQLHNYLFSVLYVKILVLYEKNVDLLYFYILNI